MIFVKNARAFSASLAKAGEAIVRREVDRMEGAADDIEAAASGSVSVETGALRNSGERLPTAREGKDFVAKVAFGGPEAPYAGIVHDAPWSASEGFLSDAARARGWPAR